MSDNTELTEAVRHFAAAYETRYGSKKLREAIERFKKILLDHPDIKESGYAKSLFQNIVVSLGIPGSR
jgi:predicted translin family RNA/ssDNA-binding protein